ncbi:3434_t:CDS:2, partial [Acaulospora morrowiae]
PYELVNAKIDTDLLVKQLSLSYREDALFKAWTFCISQFYAKTWTPFTTLNFEIDQLLYDFSRRFASPAERF